MAEKAEKKEKTPLLRNMLRNKKVLSAATAAAFDKPLRKLAQRLAAKVPVNSPLRTGGVIETVIAVIKALIESAGDYSNPVVAVAMEKATDFGDFFAGALGAAKEKADDQKISGWFDDFFKEASKRFTEAPDPNVEMERLQLAFQLCTKLLQLYQQWEAQQATQQQATQQQAATAPAFDWDAFLKFLEDAQARCKSMDARVAGAIDEATGVIRQINQKIPFRIF